MKPLRPLFFLLWFWLGSSGSAQLAQHAVVLIPSHGGSGVVIHTQRDRTWILSAAHLFKGKKPIRIEVPMAKVANPKKVGVFLIARDARRDLALVELRFGPLPYVAPVSERGTTLTRGQWLLSVGYDRLRKPAQMQWTRLQSISGGVTYTTKPPWHGRSGGALLDMKTGRLVGIVSGYERPYPSGRGVYVSLQAIHQFLYNYARPTPRIIEQRFRQPRVLEQRWSCPT